MTDALGRLTNRTMRTHSLAAFAAVWLLALVAPAWPTTSRDLRSCYELSDTFPPLAGDAPDSTFISIAGVGTPLSLSDDQPSAPIALPFPFEYFGRLYVSVEVSPNGFLRFGPAETPTANWQSGTLIPDASSPNGVLAGLWKDLDPSRGGAVTWAVVGTPPDRRFVVEFTNVPEEPRPTVLSTFQIALAETTGEIVVRYAGAFGNETAVAGIESESGAIGLTWLLGSFALDAAAVRYTPLRLDTDRDGWSDCVDNCRLVPNVTQADVDLDGTGDACELSSPPVIVGRGVLGDDKVKEIDASRPGVAVDGAGNAVVVWDAAIAGDDRGVAGRWYDPTATPFGDAFRINATTAQMQTAPRVTLTPGGGVAVVWGSSTSGTATTVRLQQYAAGGAPLGGEQVVEPGSAFSSVQPAVAVEANGRLAVAWSARYEQPRRRPIEVRRFDASGPFDAPEPAGALASGAVPAQPAIAVAAGGDFSVAWRGDDAVVRLRRYDGNGLPFAPAPFVVAAGAVPGSRGPRLTAAGQNAILAWAGLAGTAPRVFLQRFDAGAPVFPAPLILETTASATNPDVSAWDAGNLLVVWEQNGRIYGQRMATDGRMLELPIVLSVPAGGADTHAVPAVATTPTGQAAVVWRDTHEGPGGTPVVDVVLRQIRRCGNGNVDPGEQCDDGNGAAGDCCSATCQFEPEGQACDDGRVCTLASTCSQGACLPGAPRDCSDGNACTADRCDEPAGMCMNDASLLTGASCDDGNACTQQDACGGGACQGAPVVCDDGNACTVESCDPAAGCRVTDADGAACDDGDQCTTGDACAQAACAGDRVCGPLLDPSGNGGVADLKVSRKAKVKVSCLGAPKATCRGVLLDAQTGAALSKRVRRRIGKKGTVALLLKLTRAGRSALAAAGARLEVVVETTIAERDGTVRTTSVSAFLDGTRRR